MWSEVQVGGVPFQAAIPEDAVAWILRLAAGREPGRGRPVRLMNAYCVALASADPAYREVVTGSGTNFPDGAPVGWLMRRLGRSEARQVRGPSFFAQALEASQGTGVRHYFFGTTDETLDALLAQLAQKCPAAIVAGASAAPFAPVEEILSTEAVRRIGDSNPDIVWVGLGTPKQDFVGAELARRLDVPCVSVGAAFDFFAGTVPEAPQIVRRLALEWLYRLASEPRRLWRRYLWGNTRFITLASKDLGVRWSGR